MCKSKTKTDAMEPKSNGTAKTPSHTRATTTSTSTKTPSEKRSRTTKSDPSNPSTSFVTSGNYTSSYRFSSGNTSSTSKSSLASLKESLPENAHIYDFSEISTATNNFLAKRYTSCSATWRCVIRHKDVIVIQQKFRRKMETSQLGERLALICKSHHMSLIKLLGASVSGDHIYLVYDFVNGANLENCLRNPNNPGFTVLPSWISRMQIATDVAQGIEYIHHYTGLVDVNLVHNHIKSSNIIVTEPSLNAKICHFGTSELCGEIERLETAMDSDTSNGKLKKVGSRVMKFEGTRGYMSPEFQSDGIATQKNDVFAFGVVMLELLSGQEPLKYRFDKIKRDYQRVSLIETAREAVEEEGKLRRWMDVRLKDSFPVDVAEKMTRVALECVDDNPDKRPDMRQVAGKISKLYLVSRKWAEKMKMPTDFSVSLAGR